MSNRRTLDELLGPAAGEGGPAPSTSALPSRAGRGRDLALVGGAYEGASRLNREIALWSPALQSADADIFPERETAAARSRDAIRNDAYVKEGENLHKDGVVGAMFLLNAKPNVRALGITDEVWEQEFQDEVESKFTLWAESDDNYPDASRMNTLTGLVRLAVGVYLSCGEVVATCEWIERGGRPYNTAMQMIESERLSNPNNALNGFLRAQQLRDGVLKDKFGAPISYFIRDSHPSDVASSSISDKWTWTEFPARMRWGRQRVLHIVDQNRIGQTRGISDIVQALKEIKTTKSFRDIMLQNAVVNATFAASIESELPGQSYEAMGGGDDPDLISFAEEYLGAVSDYAGGARSLTIDGVRIPHLYPGQKLQLRPAGQGGPLGTEFEASLLRYIAAGLGVSYEELSRDFSNANYSSMKKGAVQTERRMSARKRFVADRFASCVYRLWFEEAMNKGEIETMKGRPDFYDGINKDAYTACEWLGSSRGQIDELKETQAAMLRVNNNLGTLERELGRLGLDWRQTLKQRAREKKLVDELGLTPVEDNRMSNAITGEPRDSEEQSPKKTKENANA